MEILSAFVVLFVASVLSSPVPEKRRESTPEILGLEQELKKAAGENEQQFSHNAPRPLPQVDGLDEANVDALQQELMAPLAAVPDNSQGNDVEAEDEAPMLEDPQNMESYMAMWKMFKQNPNFMEDLYQQYLRKSPEGLLTGSDEGVDPGSFEPLESELPGPGGDNKRGTSDFRPSSSQDFLQYPGVELSPEEVAEMEKEEQEENPLMIPGSYGGMNYPPQGGFDNGNLEEAGFRDFKNSEADNSARGAENSELQQQNDEVYPGVIQPDADWQNTLQENGSDDELLQEGDGGELEEEEESPAVIESEAGQMTGNEEQETSDRKLETPEEEELDSLSDNGGAGQDKQVVDDDIVPGIV